DPRYLEDICYLRLAENNFLLDSVKHADLSGLDLLLDLVNDRVEANVDLLLAGDLRGACLGTNIKPYDHNRCPRLLSLSCGGEQHVRFVYRTDTGTDDADLDLLSR